MAKERWRTGWNGWKQRIRNKSLWENWDERKNASIYPFRAATTDINTCSRTNTHTCWACWNRERAMRSLCGWAKRLWGCNPSLTHGLVHTCTLPFNLVHWQRLVEREKQKEGNWQLDGLNEMATETEPKLDGKGGMGVVIDGSEVTRERDGDGGQGLPLKEWYHLI